VALADAREIEGQPVESSVTHKLRILHRFNIFETNAELPIASLGS
jgi:hypothetical protein